MINQGTIQTTNPKEITFTVRYASLGRERDAWCVVIPVGVSRLLDKRQVVQVTLRPLGSVK